MLPAKRLNRFLINAHFNLDVHTYLCMDSSRLQFEIEVTNGGRITYYNYYDDVSGSYELEGVSVTNILTLGFDTIEPKHCVQSLEGCSQSPLIAPDFLNKVSICLIL